MATAPTFGNILPYSADGHSSCAASRLVSAESSRDVTIDVLRGLAIFLMVAANLAASSLEEPHPLWFRLYGSFAAPLFVLVSGMMVAYSTLRKGYGLRHFLARGAVVILIAVLL